MLFFLRDIGIEPTGGDDNISSLFPPKSHAELFSTQNRLYMNVSLFLECRGQPQELKMQAVNNCWKG